jgi:hypothetical protein
MATLRVDDFKARLSGGGARANMFQVRIAAPAGITGIDMESLSFLVKGAQLPGSTVGIIDIPFRGRHFKMAGDRIFEPWTITVLNDTDFRVRNMVESWMNRINQHESNVSSVDPSTYMVDMAVDQLDKNGEVLKTYEFKSAFPIQLTPIDLTWESENVIEEFQVTFEYLYWTSSTTT